MTFTPDSHPPEWWPTGTGTTFKLQEPLADFRGLESTCCSSGGSTMRWTVGNHHEGGHGAAVHGREVLQRHPALRERPSIDQILLKNTDIRGNTPLASVHVSAGGGGGTDKRHVISYSGAGQPMAHEETASRRSPPSSAASPSAPARRCAAPTTDAPGGAAHPSGQQGAAPTHPGLPGADRAPEAGAPRRGAVRAGAALPPTTGTGGSGGPGPRRAAAGAAARGRRRRGGRGWKRRLARSGTGGGGAVIPRAASARRSTPPAWRATRATRPSRPSRRSAWPT